MSAVGEGDAPMTAIILAHGGLSPSVLGDALEAATRREADRDHRELEKAGAKLPPVVDADARRSSRAAPAPIAMAARRSTFAVKDGKLTGGPGRTGLALSWRAARRRSRSKGGRAITIAFTLAGDRAESVTVNQGGRHRLQARRRKVGLMQTLVSRHTSARRLSRRRQRRAAGGATLAVVPRAAGLGRRRRRAHAREAGTRPPARTSSGRRRSPASPCRAPSCGAIACSSRPRSAAIRRPTPPRPLRRRRAVEGRLEARRGG